MGIEEEIRLCKQLTDSVLIAIDETYESIFTCEENIDKLLKLAPCVFTQKEFFDLLEIRYEFYFRVGRFERMATKIKGMPMITNTMDALELQAILLSVNESFEILSGYVERFNTRFQSDQFDIDRFIFIQKIEGYGFEFDAVDYVELMEYMSDVHNMFFILGIKDIDKAEQEGYGYDTNVLSIKPFKTRVDANIYALKNGISRDYIFTRI